MTSLCEVCECTCKSSFGNHQAMCGKVMVTNRPLSRCWAHDDVILRPAVQVATRKRSVTAKPQNPRRNGPVLVTRRAS